MNLCERCVLLLTYSGHWQHASKLPGGCAIGIRPVDYHIEGLKKLGFDIKVSHGVVHAEFRGKNDEVFINLPFPSVGATEHLMTTASVLNGKTIVEAWELKYPVPEREE